MSRAFARELLSIVTPINGGIKATPSTTALTGAIIDTQGSDGVVFVCIYTVGAADNLAKVQQGAAANMSDANDLADSEIVSANDEEFQVIQVHKPAKRYLRAVLTSATSAGNYCVALKYNGPTIPRASGSDGANLIQLALNSPAEGTA